VEAHVHALRPPSAVKYLEANPGRLLELKELMGHRSWYAQIVFSVVKRDAA